MNHQRITKESLIDDSRKPHPTSPPEGEGERRREEGKAPRPPEGGGTGGERAGDSIALKRTKEERGIGKERRNIRGQRGEEFRHAPQAGSLRNRGGGGANAFFCFLGIALFCMHNTPFRTSPMGYKCLQNTKIRKKKQKKCIFLQNNLVMSKKSSTFAGFFA